MGAGTSVHRVARRRGDLDGHSEVGGNNTKRKAREGGRPWRFQGVKKIREKDKLDGWQRNVGRRGVLYVGAGPTSTVVYFSKGVLFQILSCEITTFFLTSGCSS